MYPTRQCIANKQGDVSIVSISRAITIGYPLPYLVDKVFKDGTTAQFNIGY